MYYSKVNWKEIRNEIRTRNEIINRDDKEKEQFTKQLAMIVNKALSGQLKEEEK